MLLYFFFGPQTILCILLSFDKKVKASIWKVSSLLKLESGIHDPRQITRQAFKFHLVVIYEHFDKPVFCAVCGVLQSVLCVIDFLYRDVNFLLLSIINRLKRFLFFFCFSNRCEMIYYRPSCCRPVSLLIGYCILDERGLVKAGGIFAFVSPFGDTFHIFVELDDVLHAARIRCFTRWLLAWGVVCCEILYWNDRWCHISLDEVFCDNILQLLV